MDVLIVIDMQEAAVAGGRQYDLDGVIDRINRLGARVRTWGDAVRSAYLARFSRNRGVGLSHSGRSTPSAGASGDPAP